MRCLRLILLAVTCLALLPGAASAQHPSVQRGFQPSKLYQVGEVDSVNLLNGNVQVTLPIGGSYPVSSALSYGVTLAYNSKIWDFQQRLVNNEWFGEAIPNVLSNTGTGWQVSLGRLLAPGEGAVDFAHWIYVSPDGAQRTFYPVLNAWDGQVRSVAVSGVEYTRDGTYLRLQQPNATTRTVSFPNGDLHTFKQQPNHLGQWLPVEIGNQFAGNPSARRVTIAYPAGQWTISDGFRTQRVVFEPDAVHGKRVQRIELAAFGGTTATYGFVYEPVVVARPCGDTFSGPTKSLTLLTRVDMPHGLKWRLDYIRTNPDTCHAPGLLRKLTLPLGGSLEWTYRDYRLSIPGCSIEDWLQVTAGVATRAFRDVNGSFVGQWTYQPVTPAPTPTGRICPKRPNEPGPPTRGELAPPEEMSNKVVSPLGDATIHYFSINPQVATGPGPHNDPLDYGLPFTRRVSDQANGVTHFLSAQTFDCVGPSCTLARVQYVAYERDSPLDAASCSSPEQDLRRECTDLQQRMRSEMTRYFDDGSRWKGTTSSNFDGLGNYRSVTRASNFPDSSQSRFETTDYNPARGRYEIDPATGQPTASHSFTMVPVGARWLLALYGKRTLQQGPSALEERSCFDPATGFLLGRRTLKQAGGLRSNDVLVTYESDLDGNVRAERYFGADRAPALATSEAAPCAPPATDQYRIDHTYQAGVRASSQSAGVPIKQLDLDIDGASGLPRVSRDVSGLPTALEHDALGRLLWIMPGASPAPAAAYDGWTEFRYEVPGQLGGGGAQRTLVHAGGSKAGAVLTESAVVYDGLGRMIRERRRLPGASVWNERTTSYNGMNWPVAISELVAEGTAAATTPMRYLDYDPFGRARRILHADGEETRMVYGGDRTTTTVVDIVTGHDASGTLLRDTSDRTEVYDHLGRLVRVAESSDPDPAKKYPQVRTWYSYDAADRLTEVRTDRETGGVPAQTRGFGYDGRGFLQWANLPEKTANAFGQGHDVDYAEYDARGHAGRVIDGNNDLKLVYDRAERLRTVALTGPGSTLGATLKSFVYADANTPASWKQGKLESATRTNFALVGGQSYTVVVTQQYVYGGRSGRVSGRDLRISTNGNAGETFTQAFTYDELGNPQRLTYPQCTFQPCGASSPARQIDLVYSQGLLTSIPGFASSISYHPNLLVHRVAHANGMTWTQENDPDAMPRPSRIVVTSPSVNAALGPYTYDGAGHVVAIGGEQYSYDFAGRLTKGRLTSGDFQAYAYDWYGNIQRVQTGATLLNTPTSSSTNRMTSAFYDPRGNVTWWNGNSYEHDAFDQMKRLLTASGGEWQYFYDAADERVFQFSPANASRPRFDRWTVRDLDGRVLRMYEATGFASFTTKDYVYRGTALLASWSAAEGVRHFALDHLGSPRLVTGGFGQTLAAHHYFPFGQEAFASADLEPMKFTGHERDLLGTSSAADDLDYMHARYYNPQIGRFLSLDPAAAMPRLPQSWNRYTYALNDPLLLVDPDGREVKFIPSVSTAFATMRFTGTASYSCAGAVCGPTRYFTLKVGLPGALSFISVEFDGKHVMELTDLGDVGANAIDIGFKGAEDVYLTPGRLRGAPNLGNGAVGAIANGAQVNGTGEPVFVMDLVPFGTLEITLPGDQDLPVKPHEQYPPQEPGTKKD